MIGAPPTVSIIVPVFNKLAFTRQCLDRIARDTSGRNTFEVIVIDNGSTDGTKEFFADQSGQTFPIRYERSQTNLGFARANNVGARLSNAKYLLFLNNDTLVQPGWLDHLYVDPAARGQGTGSALLAEARGRIAGDLQLWAFARNLPALAFYAHNGAIELERTDGRGNEEREPDVRLLLPALAAL